MPITFEWDNDEHTILKFVYKDPVTVAEIRQLSEGVEPMLDSVSHRVVSISDATRVTRLPDDLLASYPLLARGRGFQHPNLVATIIVMNNNLFESLLTIYGKLYGKLIVTHNFEEAYRKAGELVTHN